jgi:hypothetical protein
MNRLIPFQFVNLAQPPIGCFETVPEDLRGPKGKTSEFLGFLTVLALSDINPLEFFALIIRRKAADDWRLGFFTRALTKPCGPDRRNHKILSAGAG